MHAPGINEVLELDDGTEVTLRPISPADAEIEQQFVRMLSPQTKRLRFMSAIKELSPATLKRFTHNNFPHDFALIATVNEGDEEREIAVARYAPSDRAGNVEFAIVVADAWQGRGIGTMMLRRLFEIIETLPIERIEGLVLRENTNMLNMARELGLSIDTKTGDSAVVLVYKTLRAGRSS